MTHLHPMEATIPASAVQTISGAFGERGREWLQRLPLLLAECAERWSLTILPPFSNLTYHYVTPVLLADGSEAVLKAGVPNRELNTEAAALRAYAGAGSARLIEADEAHGVMLLERLRPGATLVTLADEARDHEATAIAAAVMRRLHHPAPTGHGFPTIDDWMLGLTRLHERYAGGAGPFPPELVEEAERHYRELSASVTNAVLLHGDLHHDNILSATREPWLAIDPKGIVGDPAYEPAPLICNLWQDRNDIRDPARLIRRRIDQFASELEIDRARIYGWLVAAAVLFAWWSIEDNGENWQNDIAFAEMIADIA